MSYYSLVSEPTVYPVTLDEAKEWLRIDGTSSDAEVHAIIQAATKVAEHWLNRPIISRQYDLVMDEFLPVIEINKLPVTAVSSITYDDVDGVSQTLASSAYKVSLGAKYENCRIQPAVNQTWPSTYNDLDAVTIRFTCGYGASWNDVPQTVRTGILFICAGMFDTRCVTEEYDMKSNPTAMACFAAERLPL